MMPVRKDETGRRFVQVETEVPGTPEEVWRAIATGPGVSSWFVPTEIPEGANGVPARVVSHFAKNGTMDSVATVTSWEPPHRFTAESRDDLGPNSPAVATEWTVEARGGGTCVVRVVHAWFAASDEWDEQFEQFEHGWPSFFRILRLYLAHFRGQTGAAFQIMGFAPEPASVAWEALTGSLGLSRAVEGQRVQSAAGAPSFAGIVERVGTPDHELLVRIDQPAPGLAHLFAMPMGGTVCLSARMYLYGDGASAAVRRDEPAWQAWMAERFPQAGEPKAVPQETS
jgi:uncharacterized protein YndB with AHSA1/START domain